MGYIRRARKVAAPVGAGKLGVSRRTVPRPIRRPRAIEHLEGRADATPTTSRPRDPAKATSPDRPLSDEEKYAWNGEVWVPRFSLLCPWCGYTTMRCFQGELGDGAARYWWVCITEDGAGCFPRSTVVQSGPDLALRLD